MKENYSMKVASEIYKGIQYVQISSLPQNQRNEILKSISNRLIIKILKDDSILHDCIQYQHYEFWFENIFNKTELISKPSHEEETFQSFALAAPQIQLSGSK